MEIKETSTPLEKLVEEQRKEVAAVEKRIINSERTLYNQLFAINAERNELLNGVKARLQMIDLLRRDIARMAYGEEFRVKTGQSLPDENENENE